MNPADAACYQSIADTNVQLFPLDASGVIASSQPIQSDMRNEKFFKQGSNMSQVEQARESVTTHLEKVLYTAKAHSTGGRDNGASRTDDGRLDVRLSSPGTSATGTNPEQLFAVGWSACFLSSLRIVANKSKITLPADLAIDAEVDLGIANGFHGLAPRLNVSLPDLERKVAQDLVHAAHQRFPYSRATRGNIDLVINVL